MRPASILVVAAAATLSLAGCSPSADPVDPSPPATPGAVQTVSPAVAPTREALVAALGERRITVTEPQTPFRPAEAVTLTEAPRVVYQAILPADPDRGYIVVYELPDTASAEAAAREQATYLATGPGRVQTPIGTVHVIRVVGPTVVLYSWLPEGASDPTAPEIQAALETIGVGVDVPS
jgi:hypothetical protein